MTALAGLIGLPLITSPLIYFSDQFPKLHQRLDVRGLSLLLLAGLWLCYGVLFVTFSGGTQPVYELGTMSLRVDGLALLVCFVALLMATLVTIVSGADMAADEAAARYYVTILLVTGMVMGMICATDLFNLWIWFEGTAIASYSLVATRQKRGALLACVTYFLQTASGSLLALFGVGLVLAQAGTLDMMTLAAAPSATMVAAGALFVMGFGVKAALFPGYTWLPDAYSEAPAGVSALLAGVITSSALLALLRALSSLAWSAETLGVVLLMIATANMLLGNLGALRQIDIKRVLAFSSVSHTGYVLMAVGFGVIFGLEIAMVSAALYLLIYALMKPLAFMVIGAFDLVRANRDEPLTIAELRGAGRRYPGMAAALVLALLSLGGIPPLAGFMAKWLVFSAGLQTGEPRMIALVVVAALNTVLSLGYYLPIANAIVGSSDEANPHWQSQPDLPRSMRLVTFGLAGMLIVVGLAPMLADGLVYPAGQALLALFTGGL